MAKKKPMIVLPIGNAQKMAKAFNVTPATIYNALSYSRNSELSVKIRREALDVYGGVETHKVIF